MNEQQMMPVTSRQHCFLCGTRLTSENNSEEHVYPQWAQKRCGVRDQHLTLLNGQRAAYRSIRINCCKSCNNNHLSSLETRVRRIFDAPARNIDDDERFDLTLWLLKIFYCILIFQTDRYIDPRNRDLGKTINESDINNCFHMFNILQSIRKPFQYKGPTKLPTSTYLFEIDESKSSQSKFDWMDDINSTSFMVRIGNRAALMCLDGGLHDLIKKEYFSAYEDKKISELHFYEMAAAFFYNNSLIERSPYLVFMAKDEFVECKNLGFFYKNCKPMVMTAFGSDGIVATNVVPSPFDDGRPPYREWEHDAYLQTCQHFIDRERLPAEILATPNYRNEKMSNASICENGAEPRPPSANLTEPK